jgi:hypothetical protein
VFSDGAIFSFKKSRNLSHQICDRGYHRVMLTINKRQKFLLVHRLVCEAFLPEFDLSRQVNHKDGNKSNNHVSNLEMVTNSQNRDHAVKLGLIAYGSKHGRAKISESDVLLIKKLKGTSSYRAIGEKFGLSPASISRIINNQLWKRANG